MSSTLDTSASVLMINSQGIMLSVCGQDFFLSYNRIPWMRDASIKSVLNVQMSGRNAIEWPDLDVDIFNQLFGTPESFYSIEDAWYKVYYDGEAFAWKKASGGYILK